MKRMVLICFTLLVAMVMQGQSRLLDLSLDVTLLDNGDGYVHEVRTYDVKPNEGVTESYIVFENLDNKGITIGDLYEVEDGDTTQYTWIGDWDIHQKRAKKLFHYGVHTVSDTHRELCWGVQDGLHTYHITYTINKLIESFEESDGMGHVFVTKNIRPEPKRVKVTFRKEDAPLDSSTHIWAFGYEGTILHTDEGVVEATPESFSTKEHVAVMMEFPKGMFHPEAMAEGTFEDFKKEAFKGSSYEKTSNAPFFCFLGGVGAMLLAIFLFFDGLRKKYYRWRLLGGGKLSWFREIPFKGDLVLSDVTFRSVNNLGRDSIADKETLIECYTLRLLQQGKLEITLCQEKDKSVPRLKVVPQSYQEDFYSSNRDEENQYLLWSFYKKAAREDLVVDTTDISDLANSNSTYVEKVFNKIETGSLVGSDDWNHEEMMNLMGLKKFLQEFTFIKERGMVEVNLWNEYLVYALLFGISEKVMKDFKETCPEYFKMSDFGMQIEEITATGGVGGLASLLSTYGRSSYNSYCDAWFHNQRGKSLSSSSYSRSGSGGRSSRGGGRSFSGRGRGGGGLR
jgi:hypothetical protein